MKPIAHPDSPSDTLPGLLTGTPAASKFCDNAVSSLSSPMSRIHFVMMSTSHPGNVGAAARALKTMGLGRLSLVTPRYADVLEHADALALATGASDVLANTQIHPTLTDALAGCVWAVALTARDRFYSPADYTPRNAARQALQTAASPDGGEVAFVFGSERYGLDNDSVLTCQARCAIPTSASYTSLNLAQAVQILAYECQLASMETLPPAELPGAPLATIEEREQLFAHLEEALIAIDFLDPAAPKKLMLRMRRVFARNALERDEVNILRGICSNILAMHKQVRNP